MAPSEKDNKSELATAKPEMKKDSKKKQEVEEELSEEDQQLKDSLEAIVEKLNAPDVASYDSSLDQLKKYLRESTSSMTAIPKPLVFLQPHYTILTELYDKWTDKKLKSKFADILSILGSSNKKMDALKYRLLSSEADTAEWGHEYVRHLALEIGEEYGERLEKTEATDDLLKLALEIVPFFLEHNGEADAVDLLLEIEGIENLPDYVDKNTYSRVCLYMVSCVPLLAPPDDLAFLKTAYKIYLANNELPQALALAIRLDDEKLISNVFTATEDVSVWRQLGFILARQNSSFKHENQDIQEIISNLKLSEYFKYLVKELNLLDPKVPEDYYKSHLENSRFGESASSVDSAKQNLASNFVNAFINLGYSNDKIITEDENKSYIYKTKGSGMLSTTASIGSIYQWDSSDGLQEADKFLYSNEDEIKAGALLAMGIASNGVHDDVEASFVLLKDYVTSQSKYLRVASIIGLGISFAGSQNEAILELLIPVIADQSTSLEIVSIAALSLGHIFVGTSNGEIASTILQVFLERDLSDFSSKWVKLLSLGLGLLYIGCYDSIEEAVETISAIEHPIAQSLQVLVTVCAFAGTGNVLQIQKLLSLCLSKTEDEEKEESDEEKTEEEKSKSSVDDEDVDMVDAEKKDEDEKKDDSEETKKSEFKKDDNLQAYAVLGVAMIAMGEEIGQDMVLRHFGHLMHYGNPVIRRAVPLAMGLVSASDPQMKVYDTLSRYSHDQDIDVAANAIFSMGVVGAGTNNARLSQLLRQLASYYVKSPDCLFNVRLSQGLLHLGKGTLSLNPFNTDRQILSKVNLASLLTTSVLFLNPKDFVLSDSHYLLYYLSSAIHPRMLVTVDEDLNPVKVNVRVGQAVDTVGQAGKPKTITGWVTQETPVLLSYGERAELENDEYISFASALEGIVILKKNPDYVELES
ncbi:proteasome regulatory particle base subunit [Saccharomycopsis crataegensis]|uniref:26S proteasome regulatory subunit RPN1 n=1 Tax=Saccharomycopsis crataegensis TaxID=43959 RepID=A0AAV5QI99_9ASCO|nr:proteasome regulatory particle base subunit [Saccharomycopsis crataegensis]